MRPHVIVPTLRTVRFHRGLVLACVAACIVLMAFAAYAMAHGRIGHATPLMAIGTAVSAIIAVFKLQGIASTLAHQHGRLASSGRRHRAERVAVEKMRRGKMTHFFVVVAQFRTGRGALQEALSDTFDYDPSALIDAHRVEVIADPHEAALCVVDTASLPPRALRQVAAAQRRALGAGAQWRYFLLVGGAVVAVALFLYGVVQLVRLQ